MKAVLKEPLVHFALAALLVFAFFAATDVNAPLESDTITISRAQLVAKWRVARRRAPTEDELQGLIDQAIRDELFLRRALELGLDQGDAVVRNRMIQKMQFLRDQQVEPPSEEALRRWFEQNRSKYETEQRFSFQHVFLGQSVDDEAAAEYAARRQTGKETNLEPQPLISVANQYQRVELTSIANQFGSGFVQQLQQLEVGEWRAPVRSGFGTHAVRISEALAAQPAELEDAQVRRAVENDILANLRVETEKQLVDELQQQYVVELID